MAVLLHRGVHACYRSLQRRRRALPGHRSQPGLRRTSRRPAGTRIDARDRLRPDRRAGGRARSRISKPIIADGGRAPSGEAAGSGSQPHLTKVGHHGVRRHGGAPRSPRGLRSRTCGAQALAGFTGARDHGREAGRRARPPGTPVNIEISGDDFDVLGELAAAGHASGSADIPGLVDLKDDFDRRAARDPGAGPDRGEGGPLRALAPPTSPAPFARPLSRQRDREYRVGEDEYDIVVRCRKPASDARSRTSRTARSSTRGDRFPSPPSPSSNSAPGLASIRRIDQKRVVTVTGDVAAGFNGNDLLAEVQERLADFDLPAGLHDRLHRRERGPGGGVGLSRQGLRDRHHADLPGADHPVQLGDASR